MIPTAKRYPISRAIDGDANDETQGLRGEFVDAGVDARFVKAALRDDSPAKFGNRAVGADHFDGMLRIAPLLEEAHGFRGAQFLRQFLQMFYDRRIGGDVAARNHVARVRVSDDVAVTVHDEDDAVADAGVANPSEQAVDGDDRSEHSGELSAGRKRHGDDQGRAAAFPQRERLADEIQALNAGSERMLQRNLHERVAIGAKTSCRLATGLFVDRCNVKNILIIFDETLQQARELRRMRGVIDVHNPSG